MKVKDAAREAGSIVGFSDKTVHKYRSDFFANKGSLTPFRQGKYERHCVYHDEQLNHKAAECVRAHTFLKGEPNMRAHSFCDWINNDLLVSIHLPPFFPREISLRTAVRWLHHLGFKPVSHKKAGIAHNAIQGRVSSRTAFFQTHVFTSSSSEVGFAHVLVG